MSYFARTILVIGLLVPLASMRGLISVVGADDLAYPIRLEGIPGPYSFARIYKTPLGDLWAVGGAGEVQYFSSHGSKKKTHVTNVDLNGVFFASSNVGWVVGELGTIVHTEDAGKNWKAQVSGVKDSVQAITCTNETRCWAVGEKGLILSTTDRGNHWRIIKSDVSKLLIAVDFVNRRTGWAVGEDGVILHTSDGGKSWETQHAAVILFPDGPFAKPTNIEAVKFVNENRGWIGGAGAIAATSDGGKTWKATDIDGAAFIGLVSHDGNTVWAVNREGSNYRTRDRGLTWEPLASERVSAKRNGHR